MIPSRLSKGIGLAVETLKPTRKHMTQSQGSRDIELEGIPCGQSEDFEVAR
jgi:hypothetical protein